MITHSAYSCTFYVMYHTKWVITMSYGIWRPIDSPKTPFVLRHYLMYSWWTPLTRCHDTLVRYARNPLEYPVRYLPWGIWHLGIKSLIYGYPPRVHSICQDRLVLSRPEFPNQQNYHVLTQTVCNNNVKTKRNCTIQTQWTPGNGNVYRYAQTCKNQDMH